MTQRLFDVDIFARLTGPDGQKRVPVIRRGDGDDIEFLVLKGLANVLKTFGRVAALLANLLAARLEQTPVRVDQMGDLDILETEILIDVGVALSMNAGNADANHLVGAEHAAGGFGAGDGEDGKSSASHDSASQETATGDFHKWIGQRPGKPDSPENQALSKQFTRASLLRSR